MYLFHVVDFVSNWVGVGCPRDAYVSMALLGCLAIPFVLFPGVSCYSFCVHLGSAIDNIFSLHITFKIVSAIPKGGRFQINDTVLTIGCILSNSISP